MESVWCYLCTKKFVNRGFLVGPICPIYGVGCILIISLLNKYINQPVTLFIQSIVICSILEYFTSYILEKLFKVRWWDYSHKKYNINGRICLETMIPFGIIGTLIMYFVNPFFKNILYLLNPVILNIIFYIILILFIEDLIVSLKVMSNIKIITSNVLKDNTEEVNKKIKETILTKLKIFKDVKIPKNIKLKDILSEHSYFTKRFVNSFPKFKIIEKIKNERKKK